MDKRLRHMYLSFCSWFTRWIGVCSSLPLASQLCTGRALEEQVAFPSLNWANCAYPQAVVDSENKFSWTKILYNMVQCSHLVGLSWRICNWLHEDMAILKVASIYKNKSSLKDLLWIYGPNAPPQSSYHHCKWHGNIQTVWYNHSLFSRCWGISEFATYQT